VDFRRSLVISLALSFALIGIGAVPAQAAPVLDQSSALSGSSSSTINSNQQVAQLFTAGISGALTQVSLGLSSTSAVTSLTVFITAASGGTSIGPTLASVTLSTSDLTSVNSTPSMLSVTFPSPATVTAGTQYAINATTTGSNSVRWREGASYAGGNVAVYVDPTWYTYLYDVAFATYVDTAFSSSSGGVATPPPTPVLEQFGRPIVGLCTDAVPEHINVAGAPRGGWGESWAQWMNGGRGGAVCTRTLVYSAAQSKWILG
jgi:hypothetical protein